MSTNVAEWQTRNWGRWGEDDEKGAVNLITEAKTAEALKVPKRGRVTPLGVSIGKRTPVSPGRARPLHLMSRDGGDFALDLKTPGDVESADDWLGLATHTGTHLDALSHAWCSGSLYNGFARSEVRSSGAHRLDIRQLRGLVTRGLLYDVPGYLGRELEAGEHIDGAMLRDIGGEHGIAPEPGDAVFIRTGWLARHAALGESWYGDQPGLNLDGAAYLAEHDVAVVGADNLAVEVKPWDPAGDGLIPVHVRLIRGCGIPLIELLDLDELAENEVREFLLVVAPLPIVGGVGSPVDPLAIW